VAQPAADVWGSSGSSGDPSRVALLSTRAPAPPRPPPIAAPPPVVDERLAVLLERAARAFAVLAVLVAGLVVAGWLLGERWLTTPLPAHVSMKANAAVGLALCGLVVGLARGEARTARVRRRIRIAGAALVGALGLATLLQDLLTIELGIDQLLADAALDTIGTRSPGRMAPSTAVCFVLLGASLLLLESMRAWRRHVGEALAIVAAIIAFLALVGYAFGVPAFIGIASYTQMALHTAAVLLVLALGILFSHCRRGAMARIISQDAGGIVARRLLPVVIALPVALGGLRLKGERLGFYGLEFGLGLMVMAMTLSLVTVVVWIARALGRTDLERAWVTSALRRANDDLERRVDERTRELVGAIADLRTEIDERTRAEAAARASEQQLRAVTETAHDAVLSFGSDRVIQYVNPAAEAMFGYRASDLLGQPVDVLVPERLRGTVGAMVAPDARAVPGTTAELMGLRRDGRELSVEVSLGSWSLGEQSFFTMIVRDISERNDLQARVRISDRMASVGTLAAGVAHEINNPLTYVLGNADLIERQLKALDPTAGDAAPRAAARMRDLVAGVKDGALRVRNIVSNLRNLTRGDEEHRGPVDVREVAESAVDIVWHEIKYRARLVRQFGEVPPVLGNATRLGQVLVNVLVNAAQAIPEGHADENRITVATRTSPAGQVVVEISDTGCGIPTDIVGRIFDPFFTTKPIGMGTGLGLSICHNIVTAAGGRIEVDTEIGRGTTFRIVLPPAPIAARAASEPPPPRRHGRRGRILIVDDEPFVLSALEQTLEAEHDVVLARSGRDALDQIAADAGFDLVLCDLMMPEMTGMDLHDALVRTAPAVAERTVFMTGGAFTGRAREFLAQTRHPTVEKPFDTDELLALIRRLVG